MDYSYGALIKSLLINTRVNVRLRSCLTSKSEFTCRFVLVAILLDVSLISATNAVVEGF